MFEDKVWEPMCITVGGAMCASIPVAEAALDYDSRCLRSKAKSNMLPPCMALSPLMIVGSPEPSAGAGPRQK